MKTHSAPVNGQSSIGFDAPIIGNAADEVLLLGAQAELQDVPVSGLRLCEDTLNPRLRPILQHVAGGCAHACHPLRLAALAILPYFQNTDGFFVIQPLVVLSRPTQGVLALTPQRRVDPTALVAAGLCSILCRLAHSGRCFVRNP